MIAMVSKANSTNDGFLLNKPPMISQLYIYVEFIERFCNFGSYIYRYSYIKILEISLSMCVFKSSKRSYPSMQLLPTPLPFFVACEKNINRGRIKAKVGADFPPIRT